MTAGFITLNVSGEPLSFRVSFKKQFQKSAVFYTANIAKRRNRNKGLIYKTKHENFTELNGQWK